MSEGLYGALAIASLAFLASSLEPSGTWRDVLIAAVFAGSAYQTRTAGIALVLAGIAALLLKKRLQHAALFAAITGTFVVTWMAWQAQPSGATTLIERYYTAQNYRDLNVVTGAVSADIVATVVLHNVVSMAVSPARSIMQIPFASGYWLVVSLVPSVIFWTLVARGIRRAPSSLLPSALFCGITMGILIAYAWMPARFLLPILPLLLLFAFLGLPARPRWWSLLMLAILPMSSAMLFARNSWTLGLSDFRAPLWLALGSQHEEPHSWNRVSAVYNWIRSHTAKDAIILTNSDPALYLYTGRTSIRPDVAAWLELFPSARRPLRDKIADFELLVQKVRPHYLAETGDDEAVEPDFHLMVEGLKASGRIKLEVSFGPKYSIYEVAYSDSDSSVSPIRTQLDHPTSQR